MKNIAAIGDSEGNLKSKVTPASHITTALYIKDYIERKEMAV